MIVSINRKKVSYGQQDQMFAETETCEDDPQRVIQVIQYMFQSPPPIVLEPG